MNLQKLLRIGLVLSTFLGAFTASASCPVDEQTAAFISNCSETYFGCGPGEEDDAYGTISYQRFSHSPYLWAICTIQCPEGLPVEVGGHAIGGCGSDLEPVGGSGAGSGERGAGPSCGPTTAKGSIIDIDNQSVGELIPITGTGFDLFYSSRRVLGRVEDRTVYSPLTTETRDDVVNIRIRVFNEVGNNLVDSTYPNIADTTHEYVATGLTNSGAISIGSLKYKFMIDENRGSYTVSSEKFLDVGNLKALEIGLGGWVPTNWHFYDISAGILHRGDGSTRAIQAQLISGGYRVVEDDGVVVYDFDSTGRITQTLLGLTGQIVQSFSYSSGKLSSITAQPGSRVTTFDRNLSGDWISITSPYGLVSSVTLDANGYLASITNPANETYEMTYVSSGGLLQSFEKPTGASSSFLYDAKGLLLKDTHSGGYFSELARIAESVSGKTQTLVSRMGRTTTVEHNNAGKTGTTTYPDGSQISSQGNAGSNSAGESAFGFNRYFSWENHPRFGDTARSTRSTDVGFGGYNRRTDIAHSVTLSNPSDPFSISTWTKTETVGSLVTSSSYDGLNRKWTTTTPLSRTFEITTDLYERPTELKRGNLTPTTLTYTDDRLTQVDQGSRSTAYTYHSGNGQLATVTNSLSETTGYVYDSALRLSSVVLPDLRTVSYSYDSLGRLVSLTPPGRPAHEFAFNASELAETYEPPSLLPVPIVDTTYGYNDDNQLTLITRPDGQTISLDYHATTGALTSVTTPAGVYGYTFGTNRVVQSLSTPVEFSNVLLSTGPHIHTHYVNSNSTSATLWQYYNALDTTYGWMTSEVLYVGSGTSTIAYEYNDDEQLKKAGNLTLSYNTPNGQLTGTAQGSATDAYTYNTFGEMLTYEAKYGSTVLFNETVTRDDMGRVVTKSQTINGVGTDADEYDFDSSGRITQNERNGIIVATYGYDSNSNRNSGVIGGVTTSATYDDQDRMNQYGLYDYVYNANGELQSKTHTLTSAVTQYSYDVFGNLKQVVLPSSGGTITYEVDGLNRRIGRKLGSTVTRRYAYDNQNRLIAEINANGSLYRRYVYASKRNVPDYFVQGSTRYRIFSDHLGSPRVIVNTSNGTIMQKMDHDEFGRVRLDTSPGYTPIGFAGGMYDAATGLVRFGARDYDPETGRWTSKDPILFDGGDTNLYGYVTNDPVNWIDPSGLSRWNTLPENLGGGGRLPPSAPGSGTVYVPPGGGGVRVPPGYSVHPAANGKGLVFRPPGSNGSNAGIARMADPNAMNPGGYCRFYNNSGQPMTPQGTPGPASQTHIPYDYIGPVKYPWDL